MLTTDSRAPAAALTTAVRRSSAAKLSVHAASCQAAAWAEDLDYPPELLEIIVSSDCSTDRTDEIAAAFADRGVRLHRQPERLGKTAGQNAAVNATILGMSRNEPKRAGKRAAGIGAPPCASRKDPVRGESPRLL